MPLEGLKRTIRQEKREGLAEHDEPGHGLQEGPHPDADHPLPPSLEARRAAAAARPLSGGSASPYLVFCLVTSGIRSLQGLWKLDRLEVDRCRLSREPGDLFAGLHQLYSLVLRNAQLPELPRDLFTHLPNLMTLDLSGNKLRIEPESLGSLRSVSSLPSSSSFETVPF